MIRNAGIPIQTPVVPQASENEASAPDIEKTSESAGVKGKKPEANKELMEQQRAQQQQIYQQVHEQQQEQLKVGRSIFILYIYIYVLSNFTILNSRRVIIRKMFRFFFKNVWMLLLNCNQKITPNKNQLKMMWNCKVSGIIAYLARFKIIRKNHFQWVKTINIS